MTDKEGLPAQQGTWVKAVALSLALMACGMVLGGVAVFWYMTVADAHPPLPPDPETIAQRIQSELGLDAQQAQAVYEIVLKNHPSFEAIRMKVAPEIEGMMNKVQAEIAEVLNPEQREEWQRLCDERREQWKPKGPAPAPVPPAAATK